MDKKSLQKVLIGFFIGILWFAAMRFALIQKPEVHYHANFAVFVNGQREEFKDFTNYEEVQSCGGDAQNNPKTRTHMHDNVNHIIHVHDYAATWGAFFNNLSITLGNKVLVANEGVYTTGVDGKKLQFLLNGKQVDTVQNRVIESEDVLLISYGEEDMNALEKQYEQITKDAAEYNKRNDPSSCAGGKPFTFTERLKKTFNFTE